MNANGTLNLLEVARRYCPRAAFIFTSTNKVYGDRPNRLPLVELDTRWELSKSHPFDERGIDESMSMDESLHSLFGASKLGLKAVEIPIRYASRTYGETQISHFRHGFMLLRMVLFAFMRIKAM